MKPPLPEPCVYDFVPHSIIQLECLTHSGKAPHWITLMDPPRRKGLLITLAAKGLLTGRALKEILPTP